MDKGTRITKANSKPLSATAMPENRLKRGIWTAILPQGWPNAINWVAGNKMCTENSEKTVLRYLRRGGINDHDRTYQETPSQAASGSVQPT